MRQENKRKKRKKRAKRRKGPSEGDEKATIFFRRGQKGPGLRRFGLC